MDWTFVQWNLKKEIKLKMRDQEVAFKCFKTDEYGNIKIGVDAPRNISIDREEIFVMKKNSG